MESFAPSTRKRDDLRKNAIVPRSFLFGAASAVLGASASAAVGAVCISRYARSVYSTLDAPQAQPAAALSQLSGELGSGIGAVVGVLGVAAGVALLLGALQIRFLFTWGAFFSWGRRIDPIGEYRFGLRCAAALARAVFLVSIGGLTAVVIIKFVAPGVVSLADTIPAYHPNEAWPNLAKEYISRVSGRFEGAWALVTVVSVLMGVVARFLTALLFTHAHRMSRAERVAEDRETSMSPAARSAIRSGYARPEV